MNKQKLYAWHSLAGIKLSILICFILITGTLAVVSHEIDWLANPSKRVLPAIDSSKINWPLIYQAANKRDPEDPISSINAPIDDWFAVEVIRIDKNEQRYFQFYHPVTGKYQGSGTWYNWQRFFRMLHRHLMMPTIIGVTIVGVVGLLMFFSLISGFFLIPQWWKKFFVKPRTNNRKVFWNDCHRLLGLWASWLLLVLCVTGTWYLLEQWGLNAKFPEQVESITVSKNQPIEILHQDVFENIMSNISNYHDMEIKQIILPSQRRNSVIVQGQNGTVLVRDRANNVIFHPISGEFLSNRFAQKQSIHVRISEAADPLHFGVFYGIYTKILYFLFGTALSALAISGSYLYGLRQAKLHRNEFNQVKKSWLAAYRGMSFGKWISLFLILVSMVLAVLLFNQIVLI
jgi:uncharacterized iron-regulated membrane protein